MINLRQLLVEHPDHVYYKGLDFDYDSGQVVGIFTIFQDIQTKKWVGAVTISYNREILTTDGELNKILKNHEIGDEYDVPHVHPNLINALTGYHRLEMPKGAASAPFSYRNIRQDTPVNGRVWELDKPDGNIKWLVSFWNRRPLYETHRDIIDKTLHLMKVNPKECMYETIEFPRKWFTYNQLNSPSTKEKPAEEELIKRLMKIQHTNPEAKKALKQLVQLPPDKLQFAADKAGTTVAALRAAAGMDENKLNEDPDDILIKGVKRRADYDDSEEGVVLNFTESEYVTAVVCIGQMRLSHGEPFKVAWIAGIPYGGKTFYNGKMMPNVYEGDTHEELLDSFYGDNYDDDGERIENEFSYHRKIHFRIFDYQGKYYVSFWEDSDECRPYKKHIIDAIKFFTRSRFDKVFLQFGEMDSGDFYPFKDVWSVRPKKIRRTRSREAAKLAQQLHLMDPKQKAEFLKKMGAMTPDKIQVAADKLGISPIELRQALGMDIAENSLGNLSFSDYNDPSIPYEAKPRWQLGFDYGTVFEYLSRLRKRFL